MLMRFLLLMPALLRFTCCTIRDKTKDRRWNVARKLASRGTTTQFKSLLAPACPRLTCAASKEGSTWGVLDLGKGISLNGSHWNSLSRGTEAAPCPLAYILCSSSFSNLKFSCLARCRSISLAVLRFVADLSSNGPEGLILNVLSPLSDDAAGQSKASSGFRIGLTDSWRRLSLSRRRTLSLPLLVRFTARSSEVFASDQIASFARFIFVGAAQSPFSTSRFSKSCLLLRNSDRRSFSLDRKAIPTRKLMRPTKKRSQEAARGNPSW
jgi:hypothetical protein